MDAEGDGSYEKETEEEPSHASTNLVSLRNLGLLRELTLGPKFQDNKIVSLSSSSRSFFLVISLVAAGKMTVIPILLSVSRA